MDTAPTQAQVGPGVPAEVVAIEPARVIGITPIYTPDQVTAMRQADGAPKPDSSPSLPMLVAHIKRCYEVAQEARRDIELRILKCRRQIKGEYEPDRLAEIKKFGGSETFIQVTGTKVMAAESWLTDILLPPDDRPWSIEPTPIPDLPESDANAVVDQTTVDFAALAQTGQEPTPEQLAIVQQAAANNRDQRLKQLREDADKRANGMADKIADQLEEGGFHDAFEQWIADFVAVPSAILKGPVKRKRKVLSWGPDYSPSVEEDIVLEFERIDPLDFYPSPTSSTVDTGYLCERQRLPRGEVYALKDVEGYSATEIAAVLDEYGRSGLVDQKSTDSDRDLIEGRTNTLITTHSDATIEAVEFWGPVQGRMLLEWGMPPEQITEPDRDYEVNALLIGRHVIKAQLNPDPLNRRPYYVSSFKPQAGSLWGYGLPELITDLQDILNSIVRHLQNNQAMSAMPQIGVNTAGLPADFDIQKMYPGRIWPFNSEATGASGPPITFFQPESYIPFAINAYNMFDAIVDDVSGVPKYTYGNAETRGAGTTASGLSMLMSNSAKRIRKAIAAVDRQVIRPLIDRMYVHNMLYDEDPAIKGDCKIVARGALALVVKEQMQLRRQEFLDRTANQIDMQIMGVAGRAQVLRSVAQALDLPVDKIVPPDAVIQQQLAEQAAQQQAQQLAMQQGQAQPAAATPQPSPIQ